VTDSPNAEQVTYWNETSGPKWVARVEQLDAQLAPLGELVFDRLDPRPGERVLDVGCGCGQTALQLAERVGPSGRVLGVDVSAPMLARAAERARAKGVEHLDFVEADAQIHAFEPGFDVVSSRFGVMFFADPVAAFANLHRALAPGGRLGFVCWREIGLNPWMRIPLMALAGHVPLPEPPAVGAPGPFSFADPERVRGILDGAGFADVALSPVAAGLHVGGGVGGGVDGAVEFLLSIGPVSAVLRDADEGTRATAAAAVGDAVRPFLDGPDVVMDAAVWVVTARRSG
jgi:SAM-dependent methyltransferase